MSGKYEPLSEYLSTLSGDEICFTFAEIEAIVGTALPQTAWRRSAWWANSLRADHPQARAWLASGWSVSVDVNNESVTFFRQEGVAPTVTARSYHWHAPRPTQYPVKVSVAVPREVKHAIDDAAVDLNVTTSDLMRRVMTEWLERYHKQGVKLRKRSGGTRTYRRRVTIGND